MYINSYSRLRISLISEELFKLTDKLYSEYCLDPLEQNLCFHKRESRVWHVQ